MKALIATIISGLSALLFLTSQTQTAQAGGKVYWNVSIGNGGYYGGRAVGPCRPAYRPIYRPTYRPVYAPPRSPAYRPFSQPRQVLKPRSGYRPTTRPTYYRAPVLRPTTRPTTRPVLRPVDRPVKYPGYRPIYRPGYRPPYWCSPISRRPYYYGPIYSVPQAYWGASGIYYSTYSGSDYSWDDSDSDAAFFYTAVSDSDDASSGDEKTASQNKSDKKTTADAKTSEESTDSERGEEVVALSDRGAGFGTGNSSYYDQSGAIIRVPKPVFPVVAEEQVGEGFGWQRSGR
ncbi:MAG: hypothetical protein ACK5LK_06965 [Chthoniobacterales bacterium]